MSDAILGYGTLFQTESLDSPNDWVTAAEVTNLPLPNPSRDSIDLAHENGPDEWAQAMPGTRRPGTMTMEFNFIPGADGYNDLKAEMDDNTIRRRRIVFPNATIMEFSAFVTELSPEVPLDGKMTAIAKFQLTGEIDPIA